MEACQQLVDEYHRAMQTERDLWELVKDRGPGRLGYDQALWRRWLEAVARTNAASKALREAFSDTKPGDLN